MREVCCAARQRNISKISPEALRVLEPCFNQSAKVTAISCSRSGCIAEGSVDGVAIKPAPFVGKHPLADHGKRSLDRPHVRVADNVAVDGSTTDVRALAATVGLAAPETAPHVRVWA